MFSSTDWDKIYNGSDGKVMPFSDAKPAKHVYSKTRETDSYGDYIEGEGEIFLVFEVDGKFYKKFGYQSSYGGREWDGGVVEVQPVTKTITVWE